MVVGEEHTIDPRSVPPGVVFRLSKDQKGFPAELYAAQLSHIGCVIVNGVAACRGKILGGELDVMDVISGRSASKARIPGTQTRLTPPRERRNLNFPPASTTRHLSGICSVIQSSFFIFLYASSHSLHASTTTQSYTTTHSPP